MITHIIACFGRFNPPTVGHLSQFETMESLCTENAKIVIGVSLTHKEPTDPVSVDTKTELITRLVPSALVVPTISPFHLLENIVDSFPDVAKITYMFGSDYLLTDGMFDRMRSRLNVLHPSSPIELVAKCSGERTHGISGTEARRAAIDGNIDHFMSLMPTTRCQDVDFYRIMYEEIRSMGHGCQPNQNQSMDLPNNFDSLQMIGCH